MKKQGKQSVGWLKRTLGPGILFASTAIGVSHLVQSTRAGANYGFSLLSFVIMANIFKYPFFEFGSRYANSTKTSIITGYKRLGNWVLWSYFTATLFSMLFITSAVGAVTSGFFQNLFQTSYYGIFNHIILFGLCGFILSYGQYSLLDKIIKIVGIGLVFSTIIAFILVIKKGAVSNNLFPTVQYDEKDLLFIIALMGWMPTAVDLSSWNSLWTIERIKQTNYIPTLKQTLFEFNIGYVISSILAVCFLSLGAFIMFGTDNFFSNSSSIFANQVITLYTEAIGNWTYIIISAASFCIMFGTCIGVFDGYARVSNECIQLIKHKNINKKSYYSIFIWVLAFGSICVIYLLGSKITDLVDLATTISFMIAPFIAFANYRLVLSPYLNESDTPKPWLKTLAIFGILYLIGFGIIFIYVRVF